MKNFFHFCKTKVSILILNAYKSKILTEDLNFLVTNYTGRPNKQTQTKAQETLKF